MVRSLFDSLLDVLLSNIKFLLQQLYLPQETFVRRLGILAFLLSGLVLLQLRLCLL